MSPQIRSRNMRCYHNRLLLNGVAIMPTVICMYLLCGVIAPSEPPPQYSSNCPIPSTPCASESFYPCSLHLPHHQPNVFVVCLLVFLLGAPLGHDFHGSRILNSFQVARPTQALWLTKLDDGLMSYKSIKLVIKALCAIRSSDWSKILVFLSNTAIPLCKCQVSQA